jgi:uncharacterized protein (TIGR03086 family)
MMSTTTANPSTTPPTAIDGIDGITALERAYVDLAAVASRLTSDDLARPTNCPDWDVRALLNHTLGGSLMYIGANEGQTLAEDGGDVASDDPAAAVAAIGAQNLASWRSPGALEGDRVYPWATMPAPFGLISNVTEVAVHSWDIAKATGQVATIDPDVAQVAYDFYQHVPMDDLRAHGVYGPEFPVDGSAPVQDRLLAFLSREP